MIEEDFSGPNSEPPSTATVAEKPIPIDESSPVVEDKMDSGDDDDIHILQGTPGLNKRNGVGYSGSSKEDVGAHGGGLH